jgi:hypothetical protein
MYHAVLVGVVTLACSGVDAVQRAACGQHRQHVALVFPYHMAASFCPFLAKWLSDQVLLHKAHIHTGPGISQTCLARPTQAFATRRTLPSRQVGALMLLPV